nr:hypothetical protein [Tanacetum cinerariifolium]
MIFDGMLRNLDNIYGKFLMYPRSQDTMMDTSAHTRSQDTMMDTSAHTRYERVSKMSSDSLLAGVNTPRSNEYNLKHIELMKIYTTLLKKVLDLEDELKRTKTAQQTKIDGLERRVKKLEKKHSSRTHKLKRLYKAGLTARTLPWLVVKEEVVEVVTTAKMLIDTAVDTAQVTTAIADVPVSAAETIVTTTKSTKINVEVTQASKMKGVMIQEPEETTTKIAFPQQPQVQDKEEDIQEKVDADYQLAERLQVEELKQLTDAKKAKLFMEFIEKRRKFFAAKRTAVKRDKLPTKAQQRSIMSTYLKNMDGWKLRALKNKSFTEIKELFDKAMKRINNFIDFRTELVEVSTEKDKAETAQESSLNGAGDKLDQ